ncbi:hypothetical protein B224_2848 [Aeromonas media WS]|nr:hypothetical protein B224_2848 [Aeromonas media WS]
MPLADQRDSGHGASSSSSSRMAASSFDGCHLSGCATVISVK